MRSADVDKMTQEISEGQERASKRAVMVIVAIGVFMATLDSSIVNISLPTIAGYFGVPLSGAVEWVVIAYLVSTPISARPERLYWACCARDVSTIQRSRGVPCARGAAPLRQRAFMAGDRPSALCR